MKESEKRKQLEVAQPPHDYQATLKALIHERIEETVGILTESINEKDVRDYMKCK